MQRSRVNDISLTMNPIDIDVRLAIILPEAHGVVGFPKIGTGIA